jgi:hypothetical protein
VFLPDPTNGYHKSLRFDWSGAVWCLTYQGHNCFGPWSSPGGPGAGPEAGANAGLPRGSNAVPQGERGSNAGQQNATRRSDSITGRVEDFRDGTGRSATG